MIHKHPSNHLLSAFKEPSPFHADQIQRIWQTFQLARQLISAKTCALSNSYCWFKFMIYELHGLITHRYRSRQCLQEQQLRNTKGVTFLAAEILIISSEEKHILLMLIGFNALLKRHYENHLIRMHQNVFEQGLYTGFPKETLWISAGGEYPNILPIQGKSLSTANE